jgi:hypothetical protein
LALVAALGALAASRGWAADQKDWALAPYEVRVTLAIDDALRPQPRLASHLEKIIADRIDGIFGPLWKLHLNVATDAATRRYCADPQEIAWEELPAELKTFDKAYWLGVRMAPQGCVVTCRELDLYLRRWGAVHERRIAQTAYLDQACFDALHGAFSPLAVIVPRPEDDEHVELVFKGSGLPRRTEEALASPGEALQPMLRRVNRTGELVEDGIAAVPWTFLTVKPSEGDSWEAAVHTGIRRPFAAQRRGQVQQIAVALRYPPGAARVRFHARSDQQAPLAGYEVFRSQPDGGSESLGATDGNGEIVIPPGSQSVSMLLLRSDGQLLAKVPVPAGAGPTWNIPIADNVSRLRAQAEAQVVREQLVDVVARRAIMMARIRAMLKQNRIDDAKALMTELDSLPSISVFGRNIENAAKRIPASDDPAVQRTIDKLFSSTRELLTKFLSARAIIELQGEINSAAQSGS